MQVQIKTIELKKSHLSQLRYINSATQVELNLWKANAKLLGYSRYVHEKVNWQRPYLVQLPGETVLMSYEFVCELFGQESVEKCPHLIF